MARELICILMAMSINVINTHSMLSFALCFYIESTATGCNQDPDSCGSDYHNSTLVSF
jgi:hypothetical protein